MGPSLVGTAVETVGLALGLLGLGEPEKRFLTWSVREGETSDATLVGKDRDWGRISRVVTWWRIMAGMEIQADGCLPRIRRPYKTKGFTPQGFVHCLLAFASTTSAANRLRLPHPYLSHRQVRIHPP